MVTDEKLGQVGLADLRSKTENPFTFSCQNSGDTLYLKQQHDVSKKTLPIEVGVFTPKALIFQLHENAWAFLFLDCQSPHSVAREKKFSSSLVSLHLLLQQQDLKSSQ